VPVTNVADGLDQPSANVFLDYSSRPQVIDSLLACTNPDGAGTRSHPGGRTSEGRLPTTGRRRVIVNEVPDAPSVPSYPRVSYLVSEPADPTVVSARLPTNNVPITSRTTFAFPSTASDPAGLTALGVDVQRICSLIPVGEVGRRLALRGGDDRSHLPRCAQGGRGR
jgi:hypothetical protein